MSYYLIFDIKSQKENYHSSIKREEFYFSYFKLGLILEKCLGNDYQIELQMYFDQHIFNRK